MIDVAVVGCGAIGRVVAGALHAGEVPGARLAGVVDPRGAGGLPLLPLDEAIDRAGLVVEAAGQRVLADIGPRVVASGRDLLAVSVGALTDPALLRRLRDAGPGAVHLTTGAVGGLDLLRSAARMAPLDRVRIVMTKRPAALVQPWMDEDEAARLRTAGAPVEAGRGPAREIAAAFPRSANVAAAVALAVGDWDAVEAVMVGDPAADLTSHVITAAGAAGEYRFEIRNRPAPDNPATSEVVPYAVLKAVEDLATRTGGFR